MRSDDELLRAWQDDDRVAGNELFERHFDAISRFFANKVQSDAEELVQRTFTACVESKQRFRGDSSFRTFLFGIAHNILRGHLRSLSKRGSVFTMEASTASDLSLHPGLLRAARREQVLILQALRRIPLQHQATLELYYWEDMTAAELAAVLEIPEGTVRGRIRRAKQLLHEQLATLAESDALLESTHTGLETWARELRKAFISGSPP